MERLTLEPIGDRAVLVGLADAPGIDATSRVSEFCQRLGSSGIVGVTEWVPAYTSVAVYYEPWKCDYRSLCDRLQDLATRRVRQRNAPKRVVVIPVFYGGDRGIDLPALAAQHGMSEEAVIALHCEPDYLVAMVGFVPGFPYLYGLSPKLATPRLASPRLAVPAGSVAIGGEQTGIYPIESPGGWHLIGQTPLQLFDASADPPTLLGIGDHVKFHPIDEAEYLRISAKVEAGTYKVTISKGEKK